MKLKILNKNRIDQSGNYAIDNITSYQIDTGFVIIENYNETLDSASIRISNLTSKIDIEPFDEVMLYDDTRFSTKYMCVDSYTQTQNSLGDEITYNYEISLFSQTKLLENIVLPNLSITPLRTGTKRTIYYYLSYFLAEYGEQVRFNDNTYDLRYSLDTSTTFYNKLNVECPELQWNAPTLREVITDLMMVVDCIPILNNGVISFIDLTETKNNITNYNYIQTSQSSDNYVSELKMNMQNVLQTQKANINNTTLINEYLPFNADNIILTSQNAHIKTSYPILNIKNCEMVVYYGVYENSEWKTKKSSLMLYDSSLSSQFIKEYGEYQTLETLLTVNPYESTWTREKYTKYQNYCVYFNRGNNIITGFSNSTKLWTVTSLSYTVYELLTNIATSGNYGTGLSYYNCFFKIEYETTANQVLSYGKTDNQTTYRQIVDNQTNSWVDAYNQSNLEYQKANRLGNEQIMINQRIVGNSQDYIKIGDILQDNIVYQVQYQIYDDYIGVNAYATKNYILKDYYTGINSKIRTWVNAQDEAFKKDMLYKYYCEFSYNQHEDYELSFTRNYALKLLNKYDTSIQASHIKQALIRVDNLRPDEVIGTDDTEYFLLNVVNRVMGNSLVFTCGFNDNALGGVKYTIGTVGHSDSGTKRNITISVDANVGGIKTDNIGYVDSNYEAKIFNVVLINDIELPELSSEITWDDTTISDYYKARYNLPIVDNTTFSEGGSTGYYDYEFRDTINTIKDNKEIPTFTFQFEFCSETRDIYFTKYWMFNENWVKNTLTQWANFKVYTSDNVKYGSETLPSDATLSSATIEVGNLGYNVKNSIAYFKTTGATINANKYIYITDSENNVLLCYKAQITSSEQMIYLNILKTRNKNYYYLDSSGRLIKGGTI